MSAKFHPHKKCLALFFGPIRQFVVPLRKTILSENGLTVYRIFYIWQHRIIESSIGENKVQQKKFWE